ncbi:MAG TPA: PadR family transcriptional regulator [Candidatus Thermoplasmatota archaeon]
MNPAQAPPPPPALSPPETDRWITELKRGGTKLAILQLIRQQDRYGYEIVSELASHSGGELALAEGNVYPALHGLERDGAVASYWREIEPGVPPRKYYRITTAGIQQHEAMVATWTNYTKSLNRLLNGGLKK